MLSTTLSIETDLILDDHFLESLLLRLGVAPAQQQKLAVVFGIDLLVNLLQVFVENVNEFGSEFLADLVDERDRAFKVLASDLKVFKLKNLSVVATLFRYFSKTYIQRAG